MNVKKIELIEGKQTLKTISKKLNLTKNSAANFISKLKREGYATSIGGGKQPKIYTISLKKQTKFSKGMFDILSEETPIKLHPYFIHKVRGNYRIEDAIIELIKLNDVRPLKGIVYLLNKVHDWNYLNSISEGVESKLGALYDFTRTIRKTRKMPDHIRKSLLKNKNKKMKYWLFKKEPRDFEKVWNITIPLRGEDFDK
jgi:hypothetical protein